MIFGKYINRFYLKYWYYFLGGFLFLFLVDGVQLIIPKLTGYVVDNLPKGNFNYQDYVALLITLAIIAVCMFVGRFAWRICVNGVGIRIEKDIRRMMFLHTEQLSVEYFNKQKTGGLMALFTNDLTSVKLTFTDGIVFMVDALFMGSIAFYNLFKLDWTLALICLVPLMIMVFCSWWVGKAESERYERRQESFERLSDFTQENISGIQVIKAFIREKREMHEFAKLNIINEEKNMDYLRYTTLLNTLINILIYVVAVIIFGIGGYYIYVGHTFSGAIFTSGQWTEFYMYFDNIIWPLLALSMLIDTRSKGKASLKRISQMLDEPIVINDDLALPLKQLNGDIVFKNFSFAYPDDNKNVLQNIDLHIEQGQNIGIIGHTGSGKTTFVSMFLRLYNVEPSKLLIDGVDINLWPKKVLRDNIGYVAQDNFLFSAPISDNISFSDANLSLQQIENAAKFTCVHDNIVDFKQGYKTVLGERGVTLSGGQKQRVSIARAVIKNPAILILDDSVSAVDTNTEREIINNIKSLRKGKTTLIVAHRISTVEQLDKIIVMDHGAIIAFGTHEELIKNCPQYQHIVSLQQLEKEVNKNEIA